MLSRFFKRIGIEFNKTNESGLQTTLVERHSVEENNHSFLFLNFLSDSALENMRNIQSCITRLNVSEQEENYADYDFFRQKILEIMRKSEALFSEGNKTAREQKNALESLKNEFRHNFQNENNDWIAPTIRSKEVCIAALALLDMIYAIKALKVNGGSFKVETERENILDNLCYTLENQTQDYQRISDNKVLEEIKNLVSASSSYSNSNT